MKIFEMLRRVLSMDLNFQKSAKNSISSQTVAPTLMGQA